MKKKSRNASEEDSEEELFVKDVFTRFERRKSVGYEVSRPDTSLDVFDEFLKECDFAIGMVSPLKSEIDRGFSYR